jgi:hypothetical protein
MRRASRIIGFCCTALVLAGCGSGDGDAADTLAADTMATMAPPAAASTMSLSQMTGRWNMRVVPESGADTAATTFVLTATADSTGWTVTFPGRDPLPVRIVSVAGDSIVSELGPYESARRAGVQTVTTSVWRMQGDRITGSSVARYQTTGADSVLRLRAEGTRAP